MAIYTIADLHLGFSENKPMDIFGENWNHHEEQIKQHWLETVKPEDMVVLPGDFSWAMYLEDATEDFLFLENLPGKKLLLKGNHDYWWTTVNKMQQFLQQIGCHTIEFLHNNSVEWEKYILAGTRGWSLQETEDSEKMWNRERERLKLSLESAKKIQNNTGKEIIVFMHFPPISSYGIEQSGFVSILKEYGVHQCFYGHLHGTAHKEAIQGEVEGITFTLVSADYLQFKLYKITE